MFKFLSKWKGVLGLSWQCQSTVALQREGGRTGETLRFTQSQGKPFSHTVFSVTVHGMDDLKTPHHFVQHSQWEFNFYIYFRETAGLIYTCTG